MNPNLLSADQRSPEWFLARSGKFTGSRFVDLLTRRPNGEAQPKAYTNLIAQLVVERLTGSFTDRGVDTASLRWGREHEGEAKTFYAFETGDMMEDCGFIAHPVYRDFVGVSPDALIGLNGGGEIKCPINSEIHLSRFLTGITEEFLPQVHGCIWTTEREWWDWISYDPRMPLHLRMFRQRIYRDDVYIRNLDENVMRAEHDVRELLAKFSLSNVEELMKKFNQDERIAA